METATLLISYFGHLTALKKGATRHILLCLVLLSACFISCNKSDHFPIPGNHASHYPSDVIDQWITMQIRLMKDATGIPNVLFSRYYAYTGVVAFEAVAPRTSLGAAINRNLNGLANLPQADEFKKYYWPAV